MRLQTADKDAAKDGNEEDLVRLATTTQMTAALKAFTEEGNTEAVALLKQVQDNLENS